MTAEFSRREDDIEKLLSLKRVEVFGSVFNLIRLPYAIMDEPAHRLGRYLRQAVLFHPLKIHAKFRAASEDKMLAAERPNAQHSGGWCGTILHGAWFVFSHSRTTHSKREAPESNPPQAQ
jgi:hypothetical protein